MLTDHEFLDFVYVGTPRAGSNWLAAVLNEHREVWIPHNKELHFFNDRSVQSFEYKYPRGIEFYRKQFSEAPPDAKLGELSPFYYLDPNAAFRIYTDFPNVRIIAMLRNPVDMLYSLYLLIRNREPREDTFEKEIANNPQLVDLGFYHRLLTPYFDRFPREHLFIRIFEPFFEDEEDSCREFFRFLDIDENFRSSFLGKRVNASTEARSLLKPYVRGPLIRLFNTKAFTPAKRLIQRLKIDELKMDFKAIDKSHETKPSKPALESGTRQWLMAQFEPDMCRLEELLGVNLDIWRNADASALGAASDAREGAPERQRG